MKKILLFAVAAVMILTLAGCSKAGTGPGTGAAKTVGTSPQGLEIPIEQAAIKFAQDVGANDYKVISTDELKKWMDEGKEITIVSALPAEDDKKLGTIDGAVNGAMPKTEKELTQANEDDLLKAVGDDKDQTIVTYCGFVACRRSHIAATILAENGYENVYRYPGGITAWVEAGNVATK